VMWLTLCESAAPRQAAPLLPCVLLLRRKEEGRHSFYMVGAAEPSPDHRLYGGWVLEG
jgi:hypothetical protein